MGNDDVERFRLGDRLLSFLDALTERRPGLGPEAPRIRERLPPDAVNLITNDIRNLDQALEHVRRLRRGTATIDDPPLEALHQLSDASIALAAPIVDDSKKRIARYDATLDDVQKEVSGLKGILAVFLPARRRELLIEQGILSPSEIRTEFL